jgi:hypothetical protein
MVQKSIPKGGQTLLSLPGIREKNFSFHFKCNYLTICAVKFCEFFCTCSPSSLGQDPIVESAKNKNKNSFGLVQPKMAVLGWLGVKLATGTCSRPVHWRPLSWAFFFQGCHNGRF